MISCAAWAQWTSYVDKAHAPHHRWFLSLATAICLVTMLCCEGTPGSDRIGIEPVCGNGMKEGDEACDDGNLNAGDGCDSECRVEAGWECPLDRCTPICGDGKVLGPEACDDGNAIDWDGCTGCAITEFVVNTYRVDDQAYPDVAQAPDGRFVVVWESGGQDGLGEGIFGQRFDQTGQPAGPEFQINSSTQGSQVHPAAAMDDDGSFVAVWDGVPVGDGTDTSDVFGQQFDSAGLPRGSEMQYIRDTWLRHQYPEVATSGDGSFVAVWECDWRTDFIAGYRTVCGQRFDSSGTAIGMEFYFNGEPDECTYHLQPVVAAADDGNFVVVWFNDQWWYLDQEMVEDGQVLARRFDPDGNPLGDHFLVNNESAGYCARTFPAVAMDGEGRFVVVWGSSVPSVVSARRFDASGDPAGDEFEVSPPAAHGQGRPDIAMAQDGRFVVVWETWDEDEFPRGIYGQRFNDAWLPAGTAFRVDSPQEYGGIFPAVAMAWDGSFVVVWSDAKDGDGASVVAQRFDSSGIPLGRQPSSR